MPARPPTGQTSPQHQVAAPGGRRATATTLKGEIESLQERIADLERIAADRRTAFHAAVDRDRAVRLLADLLRMTAELMSARETAARLEGELNALRSQRGERPWWWRVLAG